MYVIVVPIQIKPEFKEQYINGLIENAQGAINNEPGCLRFDIIQDANDSNRVWLYEVYTDESAFQAHLKSPHFLKLQAGSSDSKEQGPLQGAGLGAYTIWPPDNEWH